MTTSQATYAAILAMDGVPSRRIDRLRARVGSGRRLTDTQSLHASSGSNQEGLVAHGGLCLLADSPGNGRRGLHPGDVIYWVACLGGACLLLVLATT